MFCQKQLKTSKINSKMYQPKQHTFEASIYILTEYFYDVVHETLGIDIENEMFTVEYEVALDDDDNIFSNMLYETISINGVSYKGKDLDIPAHQLAVIELEYYDELLEDYYSRK